MEHTILHWVSQYGYFAIFSLLMLGIVGVPVPDETLLVLTGYLVFKGRLQMVPAIASAISGSICGITLSYMIGRTGGYYLIHRYGPKVHITPEKLQRAERWVDRYGKWGLSIGYFIPGVRHLTALTAGAARMQYHLFAAFAYSGGALWSTTFIIAGFFFEKEWMKSPASVHREALIAGGGLACFLLLYYLATKIHSRCK
ncbi:MAG: DedA family protein [Syntrophobacteraceae bacterium]|nr:DedA family protein [Syntrophobacteraceae bacterium]